MNSQNIQLLENVELKITSNFGKFGISESGERVLSLSGNIGSISQKLKYLRKVFGGSVLSSRNFFFLRKRIIPKHPAGRQT